MEREWSDGRYLPIIFGFFALIATGSGAIEIARATTLIGEVESIAVTGVSAWATKKGFAG
jgi:hypothetical protein